MPGFMAKDKNFSLSMEEIKYEREQAKDTTVGVLLWRRREETFATIP
jgi:hypothetical protein